MAGTPTIADLRKAAAVTDAQIDGAVEAYARAYLVGGQPVPPRKRGPMEP